MIHFTNNPFLIILKKHKSPFWKNKFVKLNVYQSSIGNRRYALIMIGDNQNIMFESQKILLRDGNKINNELIDALNNFYVYLINHKNLHLKSVLKYIELNIAEIHYKNEFYS